MIRVVMIRVWVARLFFNDRKNRDESMFFWFCGENKGRQIFDKQKSAGRLIKISCRNLIKSQPAAE